MEDDVTKARKLLSCLSSLIRELITNLQERSEPQSVSCQRFRRGLKKLRCGFGALQIASFVVNLFVYGFFDSLSKSVAYELVNGAWSGVGGGSQKFLENAGFNTCLELRTAVLEKHDWLISYSTAIHVVENLPCEIKRFLQRVFYDMIRDGERVLDWHSSVRQIKFVPLFGFPALVIGSDVPVQWQAVDEAATWAAIEQRWRAASKSRLRLPVVL